MGTMLGIMLAVGDGETVGFTQTLIVGVGRGEIEGEIAIGVAEGEATGVGVERAQAVKQIEPTTIISL